MGDKPLERETGKTPDNLAVFLDLEGRVLYLSAGAPDPPLSEAAGRMLFDYLPAEQHERLRAAMQETLRGNRSERFLLSIAGPGGKARWWSSRLGPVKRSGKIVEFLLVGSNITGRKELGEALQQPSGFEKLVLKLSSDLIDLPLAQMDEGIRGALRALAEHAKAGRVGVLRFTAGAEAAHCTHQWSLPGARAFRSAPETLSPAELTGLREVAAEPRILHLQGIQGPQSGGDALSRQLGSEGVTDRILVPVLRGGTPWGCLVVDGSERGWSRELFALFRIAGDSLARALERQAVEENALAEKETLRAIAEGSPLGVLLIAPDGRFKYLNAAFTRMFGDTLQEPVSEQEWLDRIFPEPEARRQAQEFWRQDSAGPGSVRTFQVATRDGGPRSVLFRLARVENGDRVVLLEDVTEIRRREARLLEERKMESLGNLAGGLAHELNNLLMVVQGRTSLMLMQMDATHPHHEHLLSIEERVRRGVSLTKQLRAFVGDGRYDHRPVELNRLVERTAGLFDRSREKLRFDLQLSEGLWPAEIDTVRFEQALFHLYSRARQAMPSGGVLKIATANLLLAPSQATAAGLPGGRYVSLLIQDSGEGLEEESRLRFFEPFYNIGRSDQNPGVEMAAVYGTIKQHQGRIEVTGAPGQGTAFRILLPASEREPAGQPEPEGAAVPLGGSLVPGEKEHPQPEEHEQRPGAEADMVGGNEPADQRSEQDGDAGSEHQGAGGAQENGQP